MIRKQVALAAALAVSATVATAASRDYISIVGSSTVYPFATVVAETFGKISSFKTPKIESTGSGGGLKLFCAGVGVEHPDITNASRRIKTSEVERCVEPTFEAIADGSYPVSRPLFFYVKKAHVGKIPGIKEYLAEFTSDKAWGDEGYLTDKGMIPMPADERTSFASDVETLKNLELN